jgi:hypothetical protein
VVGGAHDNHDEPTGGQLSSVQTGVCVCEHTPSSPTRRVPLLPLHAAPRKKEGTKGGPKVLTASSSSLFKLLSLSSFAALPLPSDLYFYSFIFVFHF